MRQQVQSLTIETSVHAQQHPSSIIQTNATSPVNAANNPQLRYKNDPLNGFSSGAIVGIHHPSSTKNQNSRQFNLKRSIGPQGGVKGGPGQG